jgi:polyisoprenoid-binding protein YceI
MKRRSVVPTTSILMILGLLAVFSFPADTTETYHVDPVHSSAIFRIQHLGIAYVYGRINNLAGTLKMDDGTSPVSVVEIYAKTENVDTFNSERDNHLRSPDFFHSKNFPVVSFKRKSFTKTSKDMFEVKGNLALLGVTRPFTVKVQRTGAGRDPRGVFGSVLKRLLRSSVATSG